MPLLVLRALSGLGVAHGRTRPATPLERPGMSMACGGGRGCAPGRGEPRTGSVRYGCLKLEHEHCDAVEVVHGDDAAC